MFNRAIHFFYPDIKKEECLKFSLLGLALFLILGSYWALRILKEFMIYKVAFPTTLGWPVGYGREIIPWIKTITPFINVLIIIIYTKLVDIVEKQRLFYIFCSCYAFIFFIIACVLIINDFYGPSTIGAHTLATVGVISYFATESYGSLLIVLFWSFTISVTKKNEATRGFPFIVSIAQIGSIIGSASTLFLHLPDWPIYILCSISMIAISFIIHLVVTKIPADNLTSDVQEKKQTPDLFAGIRLLTTQPYLFGIFLVSTLYEIAKIIIDYQMNSQADIIGINFKWFIGFFGVCVNIVSFLIALLGTSYIMKRFGLQFCLLLYPICFGISVMFLYLYFQSHPSPENLLWATFIVMVIISAMGYAINNPTKDMMYIPTSNDVKFKVKGITDTIGSRATKAAGMQIGRYLNVSGQPIASIQNLMSYGTIICFGIIGVWLVAAIYVGKKNKQLNHDGKIIG
ncbi:MAG: hypothetical protein JO129_04125 [Candidatus Dependentiae bacterium]|nr:hypothetical protein [Candidatus Dependentiae bacterium]